MKYLLLVFATLLAGCSTLLPTGQQTTKTHWKSYDEAEKAITALVPYQSTRDDVKALGIDPRTMADITILSYADILQRFGIAAISTSNVNVDEGLAHCISTVKRCTGYNIQMRIIDQRRTGGFWADTLQFTQTTNTKGWSMNALILFVDDQVVFTLMGGQPMIDDTTVVHNPLGPLQGVGSAVVSKAAHL